MVQEHRVDHARSVASGARPRIGRGVVNEAPANWICLDEAHRLEGVSVVEDGGIKTALPEVAPDVASGVEVLGVTHVERVEGPGQTGFRMGDTDVVDVIGHQAIGPDLYGEALAVFGEPTEVDLVIASLFEHGVAVVSELEHVVGEAWGDGA